MEVDNSYQQRPKRVQHWVLNKSLFKKRKWAINPSTKESKQWCWKKIHSFQLNRRELRFDKMLRPTNIYGAMGSNYNLMMNLKLPRIQQHRLFNSFSIQKNSNSLSFVRYVCYGRSFNKRYKADKMNKVERNNWIP